MTPFRTAMTPKCPKHNLLAGAAAKQDYFTSLAKHGQALRAGPKLLRIDKKMNGLRAGYVQVAELARIGRHAGHAMLAWWRGQGRQRGSINFLQEVQELVWPFPKLWPYPIVEDSLSRALVHDDLRNSAARATRSSTTAGT